jgi:predicted dienelactone hydrolase
LKTLLLLATLTLLASAAGAYNPLTIGQAGASLELTVRDEKRGRQIPLRVYLPAEKKPAPVVLFSHGLGGTKDGSAFLGKHWSARGYVAVFLQHPGSDDSAWRGAPLAERAKSMQGAASLQNFMLRVQDVPAVLDQLGVWQKSAGHALVGRLDLERVGMSGHSFGAITTQAVSGQSVALGGQRFTDARIKAALPMSHSPPRHGSAADAFGKVKIPWLLMTGTHDDSIIADFTPEARAQVFASLPPGGKYELILHNAEHSAFTERGLPGDKQPRNPNHHRAILALSTAFWDACLRGNADARNWLDGDGPRRVLESEDRWQRK